MSMQALIEAFQPAPAQALVAQRIPKKLLVEQGAPTAADKRLINDTVDELWWQATLKPGTVGVPAFHAATVPATPATTPTAGWARQQTALLRVALPAPMPRKPPM
jgi:hypothetical protein